MVSRTITLHLRWSESVTGSRANVASKESEDPNEPRGVKSLLSGLPVEFFVLAKAQGAKGINGYHRLRAFAKTENSTGNPESKLFTHLSSFGPSLSFEATAAREPATNSDQQR